MVTAATVCAALFATSAVAAAISPLALMAPAATPMPTAMASVTGLAPRFVFSVRRVLCAALRFDALFIGLCLRDARVLFAAVFVDREVVLAPGLPRALLPPRDLDAVVFAEVRLRDAAVLDAFFLEAAPFLAAGRPRGFVPRRVTVVLVDLAIHNNSFGGARSEPPHCELSAGPKVWPDAPSG